MDPRDKGLTNFFAFLKATSSAAEIQDYDRFYGEHPDLMRDETGGTASSSSSKAQGSKPQHLQGSKLHDKQGSELSRPIEDPVMSSASGDQVERVSHSLLLM